MGRHHGWSRDKLFLANQQPTNCNEGFANVHRRDDLQHKPSCQAKMADLEAVLADVSYLMAMEKSKSTPAARASKKIILPDPSYVDHCDRF